MEKTMLIETSITHQKQRHPHLNKELAGQIGDNCQPQPAASVKITGREQQILPMIAKGYTSKMIGERLGLSARTIERHRANLRKKFGQNNSIGLIQSALRHGLL